MRVNQHPSVLNWRTQVLIVEPGMPMVWTVDVLPGSTSADLVADPSLFPTTFSSRGRWYLVGFESSLSMSHFQAP